MRMYVDGYEIEINDPTIYQSLDEVKKLINDLNAYYQYNQIKTDKI